MVCNITVLSGEILNNPCISGDGRKVAKFILLAPYRFSKGKMEHTTVPCTMFNPSDALIEKLRNGKGMHVIFRGRLRTSASEANGANSDNGEKTDSPSSSNGSKKRYQTEVIIYPDSFTILDYPAASAKRRADEEERA